MSTAEDLPSPRTAAASMPAGKVPEPPYRIHEDVLPRMDPEYTAFFDKNMKTNPAFLYTHLVPLDVIRKGGNVIPGQTPPLETESVRDEIVPRKYTQAPNGIPVRIWVPHGKPPAEGWPCFVWYHGGGWVLGEISTENSLCSRVCEWSKAIVITVDYRLAPEDPFPACVDDSYEALIWAYENATKLGINPKNIGVGGSSAGGNLAAIVSHKLPSDSRFNFPPLVLQLLVVPVCDNTASASTHLSWAENAMSPQLPRDKMLWYRNLYLPNPKDLTDPEASPIFYPAESFKNNPPAFIALAGCDVLRTEGELYAQKLKDAGIPTECIIYPGVPHPVMAMDAILTQGQRLVKNATDAARKAFYDN